MNTLNYETQLQQKINSGKGKRKGERTQDRIKWATVSLLNQVGFHKMRLGDICERADVSPATIYLYFENKVDVTEQVLSDFIKSTTQEILQERNFLSAFEAIVAANTKALERFSANAGLMRCVWQFTEQQPGFEKLWRETNNDWYRRLSESVIRQYEPEKLNEDAILLSCHAVGGMMDDLMRELYVNKNPQLLSLVDRIAPSHSIIAEYISVIWFRGLFGTNPPMEQLTYARSLCEPTLDTSGSGKK